jgi:hypothetical protein
VTQLNNLAKTSIVEVPYRGSAPAAAGVAADEVQGGFAFYANARSLSDSGRVRALAVTSSKRLANWPEIPTMEELGYPGFYHAGFVGLAGLRNRLPQQAAQRGDSLGVLQKAHRTARHDRPRDQHTGDFFSLHATRNRPPGRTRQAHRTRDRGEMSD